MLKKSYKEDPNYKRIKEERNTLMIIRDNMREMSYIETKLGYFQTYFYKKDGIDYNELYKINNKICDMYDELKAIKLKLLKSKIA